MVRLADDARKCVVFLGFPGDSPQDFEVSGTGFYVSFADMGDRYLVTAGHVAEEFKDAPWGIRYNNAEGVARVEYIDNANWVFHYNYPTIDLAVLRRGPENDSDSICFPGSSIGHEVKLDEKDIGAGDLIYVVGLFSKMRGKWWNLPFVHTGNLAVYPVNEHIPTREWRANVISEFKKRNENPPPVLIEAYLAEVHTLPGTSGSPVFARRTLFEWTGDERHPHGLKSWRYGSVWLLGIWYGAWTGEPSDDYGLGKGGTIPVGVGAVVPADYLYEMLVTGEFADMRQKERERRANNVAITPQSKVGDSDYSITSEPRIIIDPQSVNPRHREDFNRLLDEVVKEKEPDDQT